MPMGWYRWWSGLVGPIVGVSDVSAIPSITREPSKGGSMSICVVSLQIATFVIGPLRWKKVLAGGSSHTGLQVGDLFISYLIRTTLMSEPLLIRGGVG